MAQKKMKKKPSRTDRNPEYKVISEVEPLSIAAESYRRVKVSLDFLAIDDPLKVIQVSSAMQGEGKSTALLNIAAIYAEDNKKVLVIDLDIRRPKLHRSFKVSNENGLTNYLAGKCTKEQMIKKGIKKNIDLINSGRKVSYPTALLGSQSLADLVAEMRECYDIILIDCPPILSVADAIITSKLTDGTIYVVSQMATKKSAAKEAIDIFRQNNVNILGCVMTELTKSMQGSYYYNKYQYYTSNYQETEK